MVFTEKKGGRLCARYAAAELKDGGGGDSGSSDNGDMSDAVAGGDGLLLA